MVDTEAPKQVASKDSLEHYKRVFFDLGGEIIEDSDGEIGIRVAAEIDRRDLSLSSYKTYCACVRSVLLDAGMLCDLASFNKAAEGHKRPAQKKRGNLKFVVPDVRDAVFEQLTKRSAKYSRHLLVLLACMEALGLRPKEWKDAKLVNGDPHQLVVINGKYVPEGTINERSAIRTARRGNGPQRRLKFVGTREDQDDLFRLVEELLEWEQEQPWDRCQTGLRRELKNTLQELVDDGVLQRVFLKVGIYSFRHQASADAKATFGVSKGHAAAILGHASVRTAVASYGRPRMGRSSMRVEPSAEALELVDNLDTGEDSLKAFTEDQRGPERRTRASEQRRPPEGTERR